MVKVEVRKSKKVMYACIYKCILEQESKIQSFFSDVNLARQEEL